MARDETVSEPGKGAKIDAGHCLSRVSDSPNAQTHAVETSAQPVGEFLKLRHYAQQVRGRLLDKQA